MFIIVAGLPGTGKSTIAQALAGRINATYLRIDSIEQAIRGSGILAAQALPEAAGYMAAYRVAADNLRIGNMVIADSVNALNITREAFRQVAEQAGVWFLEVEIICSDKAEHRRRVETRQSAVEGLVLPKWEAVETRQYETWDREHLQIDSANSSIVASVALIMAEIAASEKRRGLPR